MPKLNIFLIEEDRDNPKNFGNILRILVLQGNKLRENICLNIEGKVCHEAKVVANHFNNFLTGIASTLVSKLPSCSNLFGTDSNIFKLFYSSKLTDGTPCVLTPVSECFVLKELLKLNSSKSTGLDELPARFIKDA